MFDDIDDDLLKAVGIASQTLSTRKEEAASQLAVGKQAQFDVLSAITDSAAARTEINKTLAKETMAAENRTATFAERLGTNSDMATDIMLQTADKAKAAFLDATAKREKLKNDMAIRLVDRPLDWAWAQLNMEDTVKQAEVATQNFNALVSGGRQLQELTQQQGVTNSTLKKTVTDVTMELAAKADMADARGRVAEQTIRNAAVNVNGLLQLNNMDEAELRVAGMPSQIKRQQQADARAIESHNMAMKQARKNMEILDLNLSDKKEAKQLNEDELAQMVTDIKKGAAGMGIEIGNLPQSRIIQLYKADPKFKEFYMAGLTSSYTGEALKIGNTPGEAALRMADLNAPGPASGQHIVQLLNNSLSAVSSGNAKDAKGKPIMVDLTKKANVESAVTNQVQGSAKVMHDNITLDSSNIYASPDLPSVFEIPAVKNSAFGQKVLAPQMQAGGLKELNPTQLRSFATAAISSKQVTFEEAVSGLSSIFNGARELNNRTRNYGSYGLPNQSAFNSVVHSGWGGAKTVNLADYTQLSNVISNDLMKQNQAQLTRERAIARGFIIPQ